jgi:hypothetical protein
VSVGVCVCVCVCVCGVGVCECESVCVRACVCVTNGLSFNLLVVSRAGAKSSGLESDLRLCTEDVTSPLAHVPS